jgi:LacI family transcriptional regulator
MGAIKALTEASLEPAGVEYGFYDQITGYKTIMKWKEAGQLPTAVFAFDDHIALGAVNAAKDLGLKVPEDLSVCGYDDSPLANHFTPQITSVRQPAEEMAQNAVSQLLSLIHKQGTGSYAVKLAPKLAVKGSTMEPNHKMIE